MTKPEFREAELFAALSLGARGIVVRFDLRGRNFSNQMKNANAIGAKTVVILGERAVAGGKTVKDVKSAKHKTVELLEFLNNMNCGAQFLYL